MELNLNQSLYFNRKHGSDDEMYWFLRGISHYFAQKSYSEVIDIVGLMPMIFPADKVPKDQVEFDFKGKLAVVSKSIDYEAFLHSDIEGRKALMVESILQSVRLIQKRGKFNYPAFEQDLLEYLRGLGSEDAEGV